MGGMYDEVHKDEYYKTFKSFEERLEANKPKSTHYATTEFESPSAGRLIQKGETFVIVDEYYRTMDGIGKTGVHSVNGTKIAPIANGLEKAVEI